MNATLLREELDRLLEDYLTLLDSYQTFQASLQRDLKQGYFNIAKSKLALGPERLSQRNWDLKEKESLVELVIQSQDNYDDTTTNENRKQLISSTNLNWTLQPRAIIPPTLAANSSNPPASSLRQRTTKAMIPPAPTETLELSASDSKPKPDSSILPSPPPVSTIPSPLSQFSAFPPPPLRDAAKNFDRVLQDVVRVVEVERKLRGLGREIKGVKKRIRLEEVEMTKNRQDGE